MSEKIIESPYFASSILAGHRYIDDIVPGVIERLQATTLEEYVADMPTPTNIRSMAECLEMRFVDLRAEDEGSSSRAVVLPLPFGNPYSPAMHIRARAVQELLPEDTRVLVFPNNTTKETYYSFGEKEQNDAIETLGHLILKTCHRLKIDEIVLPGYSQGASVGASIIRDAANYDIGVGAAILGDPADVEQRTPWQLREAFMGTSLGDLNQAINDSAIPALSEAQSSNPGLFNAIRQIMRFGGVIFDSRVAENIALHQAMTSNRFVPNIAEAVSVNNGSIEARNLHVVRMFESKIATVSLNEQMSSNELLKDRLTVVGAYGHEGGDNVIDWAIRVRKAVEASDFYAA